MPTSSAPIDEIRETLALICGDAVHNLRTAIDHVWFELTSHDTADPSKLKFPIYPTRERLESFIASREKQNSVVGLSGKLVKYIKPYKGGGVIGDALYHLNQLDNLDNHRLLISQTQVSHVVSELAEDSTDESILYRNLINTYGMAIKNDRNLSAAVIFGEGTSLEGKFVLPTLKGFQTAVNVTLLLLE